MTRHVRVINIFRRNFSLLFGGRCGIFILVAVETVGAQKGLKAKASGRMVELIEREIAHLRGLCRFFVGNICFVFNLWH